MPALKTGEITIQPAMDPECWLYRHGDYLYRYALFRLRSSFASEDVVQETLLAALRSRNKFLGNSNERTWLIGILKHKIADYFRESRKLAQLTSCCTDDFFESAIGEKPESITYSGNINPESALEFKDFQQRLGLCINHLPQRMALVFIMREIEGLTSAEICDVLKVTPSNFWVILHRARARLQYLLLSSWGLNRQRPFNTTLAT